MSRTRRVIPIAAIVVAALLPSPAAHADADRSSHSGEPSVASAQPTHGERAVQLINRRRTAHGLVRLRMVYRPHVASVRQARWQARIDQMTHAGRRGGNAGDRLTSLGYPWHLWGENVAAGQRSPRQVVGAWMASPGHRANMLNPAARHIGVARRLSGDGTPYWTLVITAR